MPSISYSNQNTTSTNYTDKLKALLVEIQDTDSSKQLNALTQVRKLLSLEKTSPVDEVVNLGFLPIFVSFLQKSDDHKLQFEAAWALTNICAYGASQHIAQMAEVGAIQEFVQHLEHPDEKVKEQFIWALGNIARNCTKFRDYVLSLGALKILLKIVSESTKLSTIRVCAFAISNFCKQKPLPKYKFTSAAIPILIKLLHSDDVEVLSNVCWALAGLSDGSNECADIINANCVPRLVQLLRHDSKSVYVHVLQTIGNITSGNEQQIQEVIDNGGLPILSTLIKHPEESIQRGACLVIANIAGGTESQIQAIINSNLVTPLVSLLKNGSSNVKTDAAVPLSNMCYKGSSEQLQSLVNCGVLDAFFSVLSETNTTLLIIILDSIEDILRSGDEITPNPYPKLVVDKLDKLKSLLYYSSSQVNGKAISLLKTYFQEYIAKE